MGAEEEWGSATDGGGKDKESGVVDYAERFKPKYNWELVRLGRLEEGLSDKELCEKFGMSLNTLKNRIWREKWPSAGTVRKRMELRKKSKEIPSDSDIWPEWVALQKRSLLNHLRKLQEKGGLDPDTLDDEEIKRYKESLGIMKSLEDIMMVNMSRGQKLRQMELEKYGAVEDAGQIDMAALCVVLGRFKGQVLDGAGVVDVTSESLKGE